jgi:methylase of polypeptide subunit release factors
MDLNLYTLHLAIFYVQSNEQVTDFFLYKNDDMHIPRPETKFLSLKIIKIIFPSICPLSL